LSNEKTLELNITHEILQICQHYDPQAFTLGTTLIQERNLGYDSGTLARMPPTCITSPLQYKRAKYRLPTRTGFRYVFEINNNTYHDQHLILHHLSGGRRNLAYYALPAMHGCVEFLNYIPHLLARTFFIDVAQILPQNVGNQTHRIILDPQNRTAVLHSKESKLEVTTAKEFQGLIAEKRVGIKLRDLLENMRRPPKGEYSLKSRRPRFLFNMLSGERENNAYPDNSDARLQALIAQM
jgi:hypothetical protein